MAQQEYARAMGEDDLKTDAMKGMAKPLPYDRAFQRARPDWLDIQPVRRIRSGSLVGPGKRDDLLTDRRLLVARANPAGCLAGTFIGCIVFVRNILA